MKLRSGGMWGRTLLMLLVAGAAGQGSDPALAVSTPVLAAPNKPEAGIARLRELVEAAEKAVEAEDWDTAVTRVDEAEVLVADWPSELLRKPEVTQLLERLRASGRQLEQAQPSEPDAGMKMDEEVVVLSGAELQAERLQVQAAEAGAVFDFPIDLNDKVLYWVHAFTHDKRGFMERTLERATQYLPMVRQVFAEEGIPQDLAFLAVIESGFRNVAKSRAQAVGMWQFIRSTGRIYGLQGNSWVEERRDPVKATRAAARYLKRLYEISGDWYLALVGYNAGPLTTERGIQAIGSRNYWDLVRSRYLRNETKEYVPKLCAAILIGRFPERYGFKVAQLRPYAYETVEVDRQTSLAVLARTAGSDLELLKELNPELLRTSTPPGRYPLRVPPGQGQTLAKALARIPAKDRLDFQRYVVKKGDTLAKVAARFKVGPDDLLNANNLTAAQFKPGRKLLVPPPPRQPIDALDLLPKVEKAQVMGDKPLEALPSLPKVEPTPVPESPKVVAETPEATVAPPTLPVPKVEPRPQPEVSRNSSHVVKKGETLFSIALRYGVDLKNLRKWNKLKGNRIQVGQRLKLQKP